jgi:iron complex outermembrane recepter protein
MKVRPNRKNAATGMMCLLMIVFLTSTTVAAEGVKIQFRIPSQDLQAALNEFALQSKKDVLFSPEITVSKRSTELIGEYDPRAALRILLSGTGLSFRSPDGHTILVDVAATPTSNGLVESAEDQRRIAQSAPAEQQTVSGNAESAQAAQNSNGDTGLDEIVVTGTNISGVDNRTVPLMIFDRDAIERSGYTTTEDFITSLPQNVKSGTNSADGILAAGAGFGNVENSTAANLRGLGSNSTLTLINGHRVAPSSYGSGVDLSMIPLSAIERIEVLTDGSSAVYGSDAVGGVINIILRKDFNGAETSARFDVLTQGGGEIKQATQSLGKTWGSGGALAVLQFQDSNAIHASQRDFTANMPEPTDIYPSSKRWSSVFSSHQSLSESLELFADALIAYNDGFRTFTSTGEYGQEQLYADKTNSDSGNVGLRWSLFGDWHFEGDGLFSQVDTLSTVDYTPTTPGYTNGSPYLRNLFTLKEADLKLDGTLWKGGGSSVKGAVGASYRREDFSSLIPYIPLDRDVSRRVSAAFAELYAPVFGADNALPGIKKLELSAAVRNDAYSDFGSKTNPRVGIFWSPVNDLGVRVAYSTSFRAPNPNELVTNFTANTVYINTGYPLPGDPAGNGSVIFYGNQILGPESSHNLSAGLDFTPSLLPGTRFSLNYYRIVYANRIINAPGAANVFIDPAAYGLLVKTFPNAAAVTAFIDSLEPPQAVVDQTPNGTGLAGVRYGFPYGFINAASEITQGVDFGVHSLWTLSGSNKLVTDLNATYIRELSTSFCAGCTSTELVNTYGEPLRLRLRAAAGWSNGILSANAAVNFASGYTDTNIVPFGHIGTYTTVDTNILWHIPEVRGLTVGLSVTDLLDANPPRTSPAFNDLTYDPSNADPRGRTISLQIREKW